MEKWFRILGRLEAFSFLLLLVVAMPLKYFAGMPIGVKMMGPLHGALFLGYCGMAMSLALSENWPLKKHVLAYIAAIFPCGTFIFERAYLNTAPSHSEPPALYEPQKRA